MATQQVSINVGTPNGGDGDPLRDAMVSVNQNFSNLFSTAIVNTSITVGNTSVNTIINSSSVSIQSNNGLILGNSTNAANGYTYLPNGFKMNWGWVSANSTDGNVTFSSAFTTNAYVVTATSNSVVATYQAAVVGTNNTVALVRTANATSTNVYWTAIGY